MVLLQENILPIHLTVPGLSFLDASQRTHPLNGDGEYAEGSYRETDVFTGSDGGRYIKIVPYRLGQVELHLFGQSPDGGMVNKKVCSMLSSHR